MPTPRIYQSLAVLFRGYLKRLFIGLGIFLLLGITYDQMPIEFVHKWHTVTKYFHKIMFTSFGCLGGLIIMSSWFDPRGGSLAVKDNQHAFTRFPLWVIRVVAAIFLDLFFIFAFLV